MSVWTRPLRAVLAALLVAAGLASAPQGAQAADPPPSPNVHLFYYSWYGNPGRRRRVPALAAGRPHPARRRRREPVPQARRLRLRRLRGRRHPAHAVDHAGRSGVLVYSWWGQGSYEDNLAAGVMNAAARHGIKVAWHLEPYAGRTAASTVADINYINSRYGVAARPSTATPRTATAPRSTCSRA